jgi:NADPH-dependent 2,4-dienoyl-CoA reductase/sulfur reductase-like enzyme
VPAKLIVIGADAAGMSAASEARRVDPDLQIVAYDRGGFASYSQCGLPYLVGGVVQDRQQLVARTVKDFAARDITVHLGHEVIAVDPVRRVVRVRHQGQGDAEDTYDRLLLATGASPVRHLVPGSDLAGVFHLDVMEDAIAIQAYIREHQATRVAIVGGG